MPAPQKKTSVPSALNQWVKMPELDACVGRRKLPVDADRLTVALAFPRQDLPLEIGEVRDATIHALERECFEFDLCDIQPASVLGRVMDLQPLSESSGDVRRKGFVERRHRVGVE